MHDIVHLYFYSPAGEALLNAYFGLGTGQIVLDNVQCTGSENKLLACSSAPLLKVSSNCDHSDDAGVRCEGIKICKLNQSINQSMLSSMIS